MRLGLLTAICATALLPAGAAPAVAAGHAARPPAHAAGRDAPAHDSRARFVATLRAPTHRPRANRGWTITVTARTRSGRALRASAFYRFLYRGRVVSTQYPSPRGPERHSPWSFRGSYRDRIVWPARSIGIALTFRVVVSVRNEGHVNLDYQVRVRR